VNQKLADRYWPHQDPIGKRVRIGVPDTKTPWLTVVGEVADVKVSSPDQPTKEQLYFAVDQFEAALGQFASPTDLNGCGYIVLRSTLEPEQMENALRATVRSIDPLLPLTQVQTMVEVVADSEGSRRFNTAVITSFAIAAVLLAVLRIYSVIAFSVASRVQEIAIRMALGSQRTGIVRLILISGAKLAVGGCALGLVGASAASSLFRSFLFEVSPFDPVVLALAASAVVVLALTASLLPARRAAFIDPMQALRGD
jgi:cell division protein FtsX